MGVSPFYDSPEKLQLAINAYFDDCIKNDKKFKVTGLALALGFCDRESLKDYKSGRVKSQPRFAYILKKAISRVSATHEGENGAGDIFYLKNHGWSDSQNLNIGGTGTPLDININFTHKSKEE